MDPQLSSLLERRRRLSQPEQAADSESAAAQGGWEFLVDVGREEAEATLRGRTPGAFLLRRKDSHTLAISYATHQGVEHALIWLLPGDKFKTGTRGPYDSLQELLYAVAALIPTGLVFDQLDVMANRVPSAARPRPPSSPIAHADEVLPNGLSAEPAGPVSAASSPADEVAADPLGVATEVEAAPPVAARRSTPTVVERKTPAAPAAAAAAAAAPGRDSEADLASIKAFLAEEGDQLLSEAGVDAPPPAPAAPAAPAAAAAAPAPAPTPAPAPAPAPARRKNSLFGDSDDEEDAARASDFPSLSDALPESRSKLRDQIAQLTALAEQRGSALRALRDRVLQIESACVPSGIALPARSSEVERAMAVAGETATAAAEGGTGADLGARPVSFRGRRSAKLGNTSDFLHNQLEGLGFSADRVAGVIDEMASERPSDASATDFSALMGTEPVASEEGTNLDKMWAAAPQHGVFGGAPVAPKPAPAAPAAPRPAGLASLLSSDESSGGGLFAGVSDQHAEGSEDAEDEGTPRSQGMSYKEFLTRLRRNSCRDLREHIRRFISSVLGPNGDATPPGANADRLDYEFTGTKDLPRRARDFFNAIESALRRHHEWKDFDEETHEQACAALEQYIMTKLYNVSFTTRETAERDRQLANRMRSLSFITPDHLEVNPALRNDVVWSIAKDELRSINNYYTPSEKIDCIVKCASLIFSVLNLARGDGTSRPGADDFLPVFIYVVLQSRIENLHSNCEFIANFSNSKVLMSKAGYCFVNLRSAAEFILVMDASVLAISDEEFAAMVTETETRLRKNDLDRARAETEAMARRSSLRGGPNSPRSPSLSALVTAGPGRNPSTAALPSELL